MTGRADQVPQGFVPFATATGFVAHNGPYHVRTLDDGSREFGFASDAARHGNPNGVLHGGAVLGFLDTVLGYLVVHDIGRQCATISLDSRFIAGAPPGAWITGRARIRSTTRRLAFVDAEAYAGERLLVTATAVFRIFADPGARQAT